MDIKEGHPGAIFHWFFDSDQGSDTRAQLLFMIYGSNERTTSLVEECLNRQHEFNDVLGPEILLLFFDPDIAVHALAEHGRTFRQSLREEGTCNYVFSGMGEARAIPPGMIEFGRSRFRSEDPASYYSSKLSKAMAQANSRAIPFFQEAFSLEPRRSGLIFAHRTSRKIIVLDMGDKSLPAAKDLLDLFTPIRKIARHSGGERDVERIQYLILGRLEHAQIKASVSKMWDAVGKLAKTLGTGA